MKKCKPKLAYRVKLACCDLWAYKVGICDNFRPFKNSIFATEGKSTLPGSLEIVFLWSWSLFRVTGRVISSGRNEWMAVGRKVIHPHSPGRALFFGCESPGNVLSREFWNKKAKLTMENNYYCCILAKNIQFVNTFATRNKQWIFQTVFGAISKQS